MPISQTEVTVFEKTLILFLRRTYALSVGFKMKPLRKTNLNFAVKLAGRSNHSFLLSIWWTRFSNICTFKHVLQTSLLIRVMECIIELNWLRKHIKSQKQPTNHSCTEFNKTRFLVGFCFSRHTALWLVPGPGSQFLYTSPSPQFVFTGSGPRFVFSDPSSKFVFTGRP